MAEDERIEQRENLIRRRQDERQENEPAVFAEVGVEYSHNGYYSAALRLAIPSGRGMLRTTVTRVLQGTSSAHDGPPIPKALASPEISNDPQVVQPLSVLVRPHRGRDCRSCCPSPRYRVRYRERRNA